MCIAAAIGGAATLGAAAIGASASRSASNSQTKAANNAVAAQQAQYQQTRSDLSPYRQMGSSALGQLGSFYGLGGVQQDWQKTLSGLPGYQFQLQTGSKAVDQNLAARGLLQSGAAGKALDQYGQGLGSGYAQPYTSGLMGLAGMGEGAATQTGAFGANAANGQASAYGYAGNAQANGVLGQGNAWASGLQGLAGYGGLYQAQQNQQYQQNAQDVNSGVNGIYNNLGSYLPSIT